MRGGGGGGAGRRGGISGNEIEQRYVGNCLTHTPRVRLRPLSELDRQLKLLAPHAIRALFRPPSNRRRDNARPHAHTTPRGATSKSASTTEAAAATPPTVRSVLSLSAIAPPMRSRKSWVGGLRLPAPATLCAACRCRGFCRPPASRGLWRNGFPARGCGYSVTSAITRSATRTAAAAAAALRE